MATKQRITLVRGADGRLRPDSGDKEISDVWAEQRRIQLNEAIKEDRRRAALARLRREQGLVGLARLRLRQLQQLIQGQLFGTKSLEKPVKPSKPSQSSRPHRPAIATAISTLSKQSATQLRRFIRLARHQLARLPAVPLPLRRRRTQMLLLAIAALAVASALFLGSDGNTPAPQSAGANTAPAADQAAPRPEALERGTPTYSTIIPAGKTIDQLGGWTRISPPDREAVYAYTDKVAGVEISVSQQPLPKDFKAEPEVQIAELAKAYQATTKLPVGSTTVHIGTSAKGPQSVMFTKEGLLILIKSAAPVKSQQWSDYINSLE